MKSNKISGYVQISAKIIQITAKELSIPWIHVFNLSFSFGIIPDSLKIALVTLIFKGNEQSKFENYRPISVFSFFYYYY